MSDLTPQSETPTPTTDKITQAARETLYLCNFRVSVDGDWLCLRELNDISLTPDPEPAHEGNRCWASAVSASLLRAWWRMASSQALCLWSSDDEPTLSCVMFTVGGGGGLLSWRDAATCK